MKTDVIIIGAGPSGLFLAHLLAQAGIDAVLIERQSRDYVLSRIRAGVLEQNTIDVMAQLGLDARLKKEGLPHDFVSLISQDHCIKIPVRELTGKQVVVYGQTELTRDLMDAAPDCGVMTIYEADNATLHEIESQAPFVLYQKNGIEHRISGKFIIGCDGYHGASRSAIPHSSTNVFERTYPFGWLGILSDVSPCAGEVVYAHHDNGFALASMRSLTRSRYYLQVPIDEKIDAWEDDRVWEELKIRLGPEFARNIITGPLIEKSIAPLRSFIFERMRYKNLFLAGDAAHIVPPTGAKGLNLAVSDVALLAPALIKYFKEKDLSGIETYQAKALTRIWKSSRFAWYLTQLTHNFPQEGAFKRRIRLAELDYIAGSEAAQKTIAENYIGLPA